MTGSVKRGELRTIDHSRLRGFGARTFNAVIDPELPWPSFRLTAVV